MIPISSSFALKVVATDTLSNTASTAMAGLLPSDPSTPARISCSRSGMPSFS